MAMMPFESKEKEDGGGSITCIQGNRLILTAFHHRSFPFLDKERRKRKSLFVKILSAYQGWISTLELNQEREGEKKPLTYMNNEGMNIVAS